MLSGVKFRHGKCNCWVDCDFATVLIRHHILESECGWAEEKFFDYALKRIRESYDYVTEKDECQDVNTLNTVQRS